MESFIHNDFTRGRVLNRELCAQRFHTWQSAQWRALCTRISHVVECSMDSFVHKYVTRGRVLNRVLYAQGFHTW